eukprot:scaffold37854_cov61-Phaeocystis_antarctica.AAC.2
MSPPYALTPSKTALPTALTQGLPRCTLKLSAQVHWPHWQRSRCSSGMLRTAVDDGVVDFGPFSCISCLATWQEPIEPGLQQPPAALWRGRSLARAQQQHPEHERERPAGSVQGARGRGEDGWEARIAGIDTIQSRCSISSTIASRPLPSLDPPRHTLWTSPCTATAGRVCWLRMLMKKMSWKVSNTL